MIQAARSPYWVVIQAGAALALSMGIGRFAYTPILPLMHLQAGLSAQFGSTLATGNYVGYLIGALAAILYPALIRSTLIFRIGVVAMVASLALMGLTQNHAVWFVDRLVAGVASALVFVISFSAALVRLRNHPHLIGWIFCGVGGGIALSGVVVLIVRDFSRWRVAWWVCAVLCALLSLMVWSIRAEPLGAPTMLQTDGAAPRTLRWFVALMASYSLEGVGYIIAGTFLVAAIDQNSPAWVGSGAWILVGLAALPAAGLWAWLGRRWSRPTLLATALVIQAVGIALPALFGGVAPALISAVAFGATFTGVGALALALGAHLQFPGAVAVLTTGYSVGQIIGPLISTPLLHEGYHTPLLIAAGIVLASAAAAAALRIGFPHRVGSMVEPSWLERPLAQIGAEVPRAV